MSPTQNFTLLAGRILVGLSYMLLAFGKALNWDYTMAFLEKTAMAAFGPGTLPAMLIGSIALQFVAGAFILLGYRTRLAAGCLFLFMIPTTLLLKNFWLLKGPTYIAGLTAMMADIIVAGGLLFLLAVGAGDYSMDKSR